MVLVTQQNAHTPSAFSARNVNKRHTTKISRHSLEVRSHQVDEETLSERWVDIEAAI